MPTFADVGFSARWYGTADLLRERNITTGCQWSPQALYCPDWTADRAMISILIIRSIYSALTGNPEGFSHPTSPYFQDVDSGHWAFKYIQQMKALGITAGCGDGTVYCPDDPASNFMAAVFAVRARYVRDHGGAAVPPGWLPPYASYPQRFWDVSLGDPIFPWVQRAYELVGPEIHRPEFYGYFYRELAIPRGPLSFYLIYGILGSQTLPPNSQGGTPADSIAPVTHGPNCGWTAGPYYVNEIYVVFGDWYYSWSGTQVYAADPSLWVSGVRTVLQRDGAQVFDTFEVQGQDSVYYQYPPSTTLPLVPGNYLQTSSHRVASGACHIVLPAAAQQTTVWPASGQPEYLPVTYSLTTAVNSPGSGTITPLSGMYNSGSQIWVTAQANPGYVFTGFSGALSGTTNPQIVVMNGNKSVIENFAAANPDFYLAPIPSANAQSGTHTHVSAVVVPQNGFTSPVNFSYDPATWPASIAGTFSPFTVTSTSWMTTITISVLTSTAPGTYSLPVTAEGGGLRRTGHITLTVSPGSNPAVCQGTVLGISAIAHYWEINRIETYSATSLDYCTAALYDAFVAGYLYQAGTADPIRHGSDRSSPTAWGTMNAPAQGGHDYELESDHYVVAYFAFVYSVYGEAVFRDPLGFSLISTSPPSGPTGSGAYIPTFTAVFVIPQYLYLGTTVVWVPTSDQMPVITSLNPGNWERGATVYVTISGTGFGSGGQLEVSGDALVFPVVLGWADNSIQANFTIHPQAATGSRIVTVISSGWTGMGFITGPGRSARSNPANVVVLGSSCSVSIADGGQKYSLGADYRTASVPLRAESTCQGTVTWTIKFYHQTSAGKGASLAGPYEVSSNLNETLNYSTPPGAGGRMDVTAQITIGGQTVHTATRFFIAGVQIPDQTITERLVGLYAGGGTPRLMTGLAMRESSYRQFSSTLLNGPPNLLFGIPGLWPYESYDGGSHVGLMMVPTQMGVAYDWQQNTQDGVYLFAGQKLQFAGNYEASIRSRFPNLRPLTLQEHELNALVFYGPPSIKVSQSCETCPTGKLGAYWVPNGQGTDWIVNRHHPEAVRYVGEVLALIR